MILELVVSGIERLTDDISLFSLAAPDGGPLPPFTPGAHVDFSLGASGSRSYSLVDFTGDTDAATRYRIAVQREMEGQGGSMAMHSLSEGDRLSATGPSNSFALHEGNAPALLLAGGIGITPMPSFAAELFRRGAPFQLHYCARTESRAAFAARLKQAFGDAVRIWFDDTCPADLAALVGAADPAAHVYCCGPSGMIDAARALALESGYLETQFHFELFTTPAPNDDDAQFEVEIHSTGKVLTIPPGKSIIDVLEENGHDVMYDCRRGDCGICQTEVVSGNPDHRDVVLTEEERASGKVMQICVSRAKSARLVLDL